MQKSELQQNAIFVQSRRTQWWCYPKGKITSKRQSLTHSLSLSLCLSRWHTILQLFAGRSESMAAKRLVIVVDGTAAMGPYWRTIVSDYLEKIIRYNTTLSLSLSSVLLNCVYGLDIILCSSHNVVLDDI